MTKPLLLLLPGLMCDAGVWKAQIAAFEGAYDVRVPDFFGLDSFDGMTEAVLALADRPFEGHHLPLARLDVAFTAQRRFAASSS